MAYYNANGQVTIDRSAAEADKRNIRNAMTKLEDSLRSISNLRGSASSMQGQTGMAIVEQCNKLEAQIKALNERLSMSMAFISATVEKYAEEDRQLAARIRSGGGI